MLTVPLKAHLESMSATGMATGLKVTEKDTSTEPGATLRGGA